VVRGEQVANLGHWYRIYIGPFTSSQEAKLKSKELKKKGLVNYTSVQKKDFLIRSGSEKRHQIEKGAVLTATAKAGKEYSPPQKLVKPSPKKPTIISPAVEKTPEAKKVPAPVSPSPTLVKVEPHPKISVEPSEKTPELQRRGSGRNVAQGRFSLALQHTYREVQTELTELTSITSDGTTTTKQDVSISSSEKNDFDTDMHMDMLRVRFGATNFLEIFGDAGVSYDQDDIEDLNFTYGGGTRLNLFEVKGGSIRGFYSALQGEYLKGKLETEYQSIQGNRFSKDADWWQFTGKGEVGLIRNRFAVYIGGAYLTYNEDTDRKQLENLPPGLVSVKFKDNLEEENSFGAYGGLSIHLTPGFLMNVEGQVLTQKSIAGSIEYRF
jgi:hypothetical protein